VSNQNLRRDEAAARATLITTHSYDVSLDVRQAADPNIAGYTSRSVISFSASEPGASTFVDFIGDSVHSVFLNGKGLPVADVVDGSRIRLENLQPENQVTVTGTALYSTSGEGMHRFVDPADGQCYLYTQYEPADARRVFANFEQPDLKAEFTFHVMAPSDWQVSSNGVEVLRTQLTSDPATSRWDFAPTKAMSTYITTVLAGPYFKAEDAWSGTLETARSWTCRWHSTAEPPWPRPSTPRRCSASPRTGWPTSTSSSISLTRGANTNRHSCPSTTSAPWKTRDW
jgi:aminopeptidase N